MVSPPCLMASLPAIENKIAKDRVEDILSLGAVANFQ